MKSVQIQSFFWSVFSRIHIEYAKITPYLDTFQVVEKLAREAKLMNRIFPQSTPSFFEIVCYTPESRKH